MPSPPPAWLRWAPALFVFLWSTGFIGSRLGAPFAEPLTFLSWRYAAAIVLLVAAAMLTRSAWPASPLLAGHAAVAGLLVQGAYLGGVFCSVARGMPLATVSLIVGLQPILTAMAAGPLLGERLTSRQWFGIALGFGGVVLVVSGKWTGAATDPAGYAWLAFALFGITAGTLYQKRFCGAVPMLTGGVSSTPPRGSSPPRPRTRPRRWWCSGRRSSPSRWAGSCWCSRWGRSGCSSP